MTNRIQQAPAPEAGAVTDRAVWENVFGIPPTIAKLTTVAPRFTTDVGVAMLIFDKLSTNITDGRPAIIASSEAGAVTYKIAVLTNEGTVNHTYPICVATDLCCALCGWGLAVTATHFGLLLLCETALGSPVDSPRHAA